jgi:uncharacterized membrane protein YbhN (UPF0104 family)
MQRPSHDGSARQAARWAIQIALTVAVTFFLFRSLRLSWQQLEQLGSNVWRPRLLPLAASFALLLAVFAYLVGLWSRMVRRLGGPALGLGESIRIFFLANLGRYVPGKVWQLAGLAYLAGKRGVSIPVASSAAVLGQLFSLGAAGVLAALALAVSAGTRLPSELLPIALGLAVLIALFTLVPGALRLTLRVAFRVGRSREDAPRLDPWFGARWLTLYLPAWLGYGVAFGLLWSAFEPLPPVSWLAAVGGFCGAYFLGYAAVFAPAGVGVREGAMAVLLAPWLGAAPATVLALVARVWMTVAELLPLAGVGWVAAARWLRPKTEPR